jgi:hypothetical protein
MPRIRAYWYHTRSIRDRNPIFVLNEQRQTASAFYPTKYCPTLGAEVVEVDPSLLNDNQLTYEFIEATRRIDLKGADSDKLG